MQDAAIAKVLQGEARRGEEEECRPIEPNAKDDTNPWLEFMQWRETFLGKDLAVSESNWSSALLTIIFS